MNDWGSAAGAQQVVTRERVTLQYCCDQVLDCIAQNKPWKAAPEHDLHALVRTAFHLYCPSRFWQLRRDPTPEQAKAFWTAQLQADPWRQMLVCAQGVDYKGLRGLLTRLFP